MFDTVRLYTMAIPSDDQLGTFWERRVRERPGFGPHVEHFYNPDDPRGIHPRYTYRPVGIANHNQFFVELSIPKLVFGNNWQLVDDLPGAIANCDELLVGDPALPYLPPVEEWKISRVDPCWNYDVGDLLPQYIDALARLDYPHRTTVRYNSETVEFQAKSVKTKFYDKHAETTGTAPPGLLRHEITLPRMRSVKSAFSTRRDVHLTDLTPDRIEALLRQDLARLGILDMPIVTHRIAARTLTDHYGTTCGPRLYGILCIYQRLGRQATADHLGITRDSVSRLLHDVRKAGVSTALTDTDDPLPPFDMCIPHMTPPPKICSQTPGVTQGSLASEDETEVAYDDDL